MWTAVVVAVVTVVGGSEVDAVVGAAVVAAEELTAVTVSVLLVGAVEVGEDEDTEEAGDNEGPVEEMVVFDDVDDESSLSNRSSFGYGFSPWFGLFSDSVSMDSIPESSPCW